MLKHSKCTWASVLAFSFQFSAKIAMHATSLATTVWSSAVLSPSSSHFHLPSCPRISPLSSSEGELLSFSLSASAFLQPIWSEGAFLRSLWMGSRLAQAALCRFFLYFFENVPAIAWNSQSSCTTVRKRKTLGDTWWRKIFCLYVESSFKIQLPPPPPRQYFIGVWRGMKREPQRTFFAQTLVHLSFSQSSVHFFHLSPWISFHVSRFDFAYFMLNVLLSC